MDYSDSSRFVLSFEGPMSTVSASNSFGFAAIGVEAFGVQVVSRWLHEGYGIIVFVGARYKHMRIHEVNYSTYILLDLG
jgi:hypothetical protein